LRRVQELSTLSKTGNVTLSCNGKRKVACILDECGVIESLDLSTEAEEFDFEPDSDDEVDEGDEEGEASEEKPAREGGGGGAKGSEDKDGVIES